MRSKKLLTTIVIFILALAQPASALAITTTELINQYPQVTSSSLSTTQITVIRNNINNLLQDNTHRQYPAGMYAEDINKISFWKGMEVATLARTIPYLDTTTATNLKTYLKYEVDNYLTNQAYIDWMRGSNSSLSAKLPIITWRSDFWQWRGVDLEILHALWAYGHYTGDWTTIQNKWTSINNLLNGVNTSKGSKKYMGGFTYYRAPNSEVAGRLAYIRMAKKLYQITGTASYQTQMQSQTTTLTNSLSGLLSTNISSNQFQSQVCDFDAAVICVAGSNVDSRDVKPHLAQFDFLTPEIGRYLKDSYQSQVNSVISQIETEIPWWYLGSYNLYSRGGREGYYEPPVLGHQIFQAKTQVLQNPAAELETKLPPAEDFATLPNYWDALHYADLLSLIERKESVTWTDSNTVPLAVPFNPGASPSPSSQPSPTPNPADINQDGSVNGTDAKLVLNSWLGTVCQSFICDITVDTKINSLDFGWISKGWGN